MTLVKAYHHSHKGYYRYPFGAAQCNEKVTLRIQILSNLTVQECILRLWEKEQEKIIPMNGLQQITENGLTQWVYEADFLLPQDPGLVWYYFRYSVNGKIYFYGNNPEVLGGEGEQSEIEPPSYQITVYRASYVPEWFRKGIIYQIYVDRFANGTEGGEIHQPKPKSLLHGDWYDTPFYIKDDQGRVTRWTFFGGNIQGVINKLPYLEELGISIIYLNPIFEAASNHKYDTGDYLKIDPMYGDEESFALLIREAQQHGISVILDGVFNHTGSDSIYFNKYGNYPGIGAFQSAESPYYSWYRFKGSQKDYECWWGIDDLPHVNELEPSYQDFIYQNEKSVIRTWMQRGVKGWRLDVADELPDEFIKGIKKAVKEMDPQSVLIGEVWEDASRKISYGKLREYFWGDELDSVMNYPLRKILLEYVLGVINARMVVNHIMSLYENYPRENFQAAMNLIGSHDRARILTLLGDAPPEDELSEYQRESYRLPPEAREKAIRRLKLISLLQLTLPGVPSIYYGDEAGTEGFSDPYNRGTFPWGREDQEILEWYKRILRLRNEYEILNTGFFLPFEVGEDIFGFGVKGEDEEILVLTNRSIDKERKVDLYLLDQVCQQKLAEKLNYDQNTESQNPDIKKNEASISIRNNRKTPLQKDNLSVNQPANPILMLDLLSGIIIKQSDKNNTIRLQPLEGKMFYKKYITELRLDRSSGCLLHLTSLPSPWGIGDLGQEAREFVDFLAASGQKLWQVLPLNPPGEWHSPYQSASVFAGNTLLISLDSFVQEGLLTAAEVNEALVEIKPQVTNQNRVYYNLVKKKKEQYLAKACRRFQSILQKQKDNLLEDEKYGKYVSGVTYQKFIIENEHWLEDYALYMVLKEHFQGLPWNQWGKPIATRDKAVLSELFDQYQEQIEYHRFAQYTFFYQWKSLKKYANAKGIKVIGDLPIYVAGDSCDTWVHSLIFALNEQGIATAVAGVPPDYFSDTGQLWGNPLYRWKVLENANYYWWRERVRQALDLFDYVRLDHFRGFEAYWEVPGFESTAVNGRWLKGPGKKLFEYLEDELGPLPLLAEDLGVITPEVHNLRNICGFPGMKVYQFASQELDDPRTDLSDTIVYSGTHDNDTLYSWYRQNKGENLKAEVIRDSCKEILRRLYESNAPWAIIPLQDLLMLDCEARMNIPGTVEGNWMWRFEKDDLSSELTNWLRTMIQLAARD